MTKWHIIGKYIEEKGRVEYYIDTDQGSPPQWSPDPTRAYSLENIGEARVLAADLNDEVGGGVFVTAIYDD